MVAVLVFLVLPLALLQGAVATVPIPLLYFVAVGLGYILVEIAFIQRFVLFLGHPTYALTVVIFLLMLSSGAGSLFSRLWIPKAEMGWVPLHPRGAHAFGLRFFPSQPAGCLVGMDFGFRLLVSGVLLIPLGFVMGMPFPTGLRALASSPAPNFRQALDNAVEWAWAMNAAASVLGSVLAMVIAIQFGLTVTLACGAAAYLLALV